MFENLIALKIAKVVNYVLHTFTFNSKCFWLNNLWLFFNNIFFHFFFNWLLCLFSNFLVLFNLLLFNFGRFFVNNFLLFLFFAFLFLFFFFFVSLLHHFFIVESIFILLNFFNRKLVSIPCFAFKNVVINFHWLHRIDFRAENSITFNLFFLLPSKDYFVGSKFYFHKKFVFFKIGKKRINNILLRVKNL